MEKSIKDYYLDSINKYFEFGIIDTEKYEEFISFLENDDIRHASAMLDSINELHGDFFKAKNFSKRYTLDSKRELESINFKKNEEIEYLKSKNKELMLNLNELKGLEEHLIKTELKNQETKNKINEIIVEKNNLVDEKKSLLSERIILIKENNELKALSQQKRIDKEIPGYVEKVSDKLDADDLFFTEMSRNWSVTGVVVTLFAVFAAFCTFSQGTDLILKNTNIEWIGLLYIFIRGGLGIGLLSWLAFVCFSNSRNYTHESIRRKDRQHALSFGQLFLQIYGSSATKEDAMLVFKDWNMSGDSAFSKAADTPPNILETLKSIMPSTMKSKGLDNEGK
ncbi:hypothetical protein [Yersinia mollaretii]|uniref:hypothetical protein n=1 Tax=Yersinia mollaretii TaxID=33060 RepID=UPI0021BD73F6|nr:hypothetical protein [Yersinia mollaretii]